MFPACESLIHEFGPFAPPPPADYRADWHGCVARHTCEGCLSALREMLQKHAVFKCAECGGHYPNPNEYITWERL